MKPIICPVEVEHIICAAITQLGQWAKVPAPCSDCPIPEEVAAWRK